MLDNGTLRHSQIASVVISTKSRNTAMDVRIVDAQCQKHVALATDRTIGIRVGHGRLDGESDSGQPEICGSESANYSTQLVNVRSIVIS